MATSAPRRVTLPDGSVVDVSLTPQPWWTKKHGTGFVHPDVVAPDPRQPRQYMNPERVAELHQSIAAIGVRESITVTPVSSAPWVEVGDEHKDAFFVIVSGHRRWNGARRAGLEAIPVKVEMYASEKEHRLDASLLNYNREDLTPLEEGYEILRLKMAGWTLNRLSEFFGLSTPLLYGRMSLTNLHQDIKALLDPALPRKKRLPTTIAENLGAVKVPTLEELEELRDSFTNDLKGKDFPDDNLEEFDDDGRRFALQKLLLAVIQKRSLGSNRAIELIKEHSLHLESVGANAGRKPERYKPTKRRDVLNNLVKEITSTITNTAVMDWQPAEFRRIFEYAIWEDVEELVGKLKEAEEFLAGLGKILKRIRDEKKPTHPDVIRIMRERKEGSVAQTGKSRA